MQFFKHFHFTSHCALHLTSFTSSSHFFFLVFIVSFSTTTSTWLVSIIYVIDGFSRMISLELWFQRPRQSIRVIISGFGLKYPTNVCSIIFVFLENQYFSEIIELDFRQISEMKTNKQTHDYLVFSKLSANACTQQNREAILTRINWSSLNTSRTNQRTKEKKISQADSNVLLTLRQNSTHWTFSLWNLVASHSMPKREIGVMESRKKRNITYMEQWSYGPTVARDCNEDNARLDLRMLSAFPVLDRLRKTTKPK